jgi:hypothetical protein
MSFQVIEISMTNLPTSQALEAWHALSFPLTRSNGSNESFVRFSPVGSHDRTLPREFFDPALHHLSDPLADKGENAEMALQAGIKLRNQWIDTHGADLLDYYHQQQGGVICTDILPIALRAAYLRRGADAAVTAVTILPGRTQDTPGTTFVSIWDNGLDDTPPEEIVHAYAPPDADAQKPDRTSAPERLITHAVVDVLHGTLTIANGSHRVDITKSPEGKILRKVAKVASYAGTTVITALPHFAV